MINQKKGLCPLEGDISHVSRPHSPVRIAVAVEDKQIKLLFTVVPFRLVRDILLGLFDSRLFGGCGKVCVRMAVVAVEAVRFLIEVCLLYTSPSPRD